MKDTFENVFENTLKEDFDKLEKDWDGLQLVLDSIKDNYVCDCMKNYGKGCLFPEKYRKEGCN